MGYINYPSTGAGFQPSTVPLLQPHLPTEMISSNNGWRRNGELLTMSSAFQHISAFRQCFEIGLEMTKTFRPEIHQHLMEIWKNISRIDLCTWPVTRGTTSTHFDFSWNTPGSDHMGIWESHIFDSSWLRLMVQKSQGQPPFGCNKPCK